MLKKAKNNKQKSNLEKRPGIFQLINPFALKAQINKLETTEFNKLSYLKFILFCIAGLIGFTFVFKLKGTYFLILLLLTILLLPSIYYINIRNIYEKERFMDVSSYIEQLLYSFKRQPKILVALQDTAILFEDEKHSRLKRCIDEAIAYIQKGVSEENIYKEAFAIIEKEYGCKRMYKVHEFLVRVETAGGVAEEAIAILLQDRSLWVSRIQTLLQDRQKIRINVTIGIGLSLLVVAMGTYMIPADFGITVSTPSQIAKTVTIALDMLIWYAVQLALGTSLLAVDRITPFEELERSYHIVMHDGVQKKKQMNFLICAFVLIIGAFITYFTIGLKPALLVAMLALLMATQPNRQYKSCFKRIKREVEKTFPDWLLALALQMQTDNVHVSIVKTSMDAPMILKEELNKFQDGIEKYPNDLRPYTNFFKKLAITDVLTAMKMLYAMAEFGASDSQEQIKGLVNRNTEIMDKAERMRMEDSLAGISFAMLLPMITGVITLITDLALVFTTILSQVSTL